MADLSRIVGMLDLKRQELLQQLAAVDQAIALLRSAPAGDVVEELIEDHLSAESPSITSPPLVPTRVKAKRVLGEGHKQALTIGRRKARQAKDAAAGHAREMLDASFVPALATRRVDALPRLVKTPRNRP